MVMILQKYKLLFVALALGFGMMTAVPMPAVAGGATTAQDDFGGIGAKLCRVVRAVTGNVGRAIATFAVIFLGIGAFFGKVTWGLAVAIGMGIFAIFGAAKIVGNFQDTAQASTGCNT